MQIREIRVSELETFVESDFFRNSIHIPITPLRAKSQANNPNAKPDDVVLIAAYSDEGELLSYVGALPDQLANGDQFTWNSCWYAHPEKGKTVALPVFLQFIKHWKGRILMRDLTSHTRQIIGKLPYFQVMRSDNQIRYFTRFYLSDLLKTKKPKLAFLAPLLKIDDAILNVIPAFLSLRWIMTHHYPTLKLESIDHIDDESAAFIDEQKAGELIARGSKELKWVLNYPWLMPPEKDTRGISSKYHFSAVAKQFRYKCLKVKADAEMVAFMLIKEREKHLELPYYYCKKGHEQEMVNLLIRFLRRERCRSFTTSNSKLIEELRALRFPCLYKRTSIQELYAAKELVENIDPNASLQDGDGDVVFA